MSTFIIAFIIFALAGLGIPSLYQKEKALVAIRVFLVRLRKKCIRLIANKIIYRKMVSYSFKRPFSYDCKKCIKVSRLEV